MYFTLKHLCFDSYLWPGSIPSSTRCPRRVLRTPCPGESSDCLKSLQAVFKDRSVAKACGMHQVSCLRKKQSAFPGARFYSRWDLTLHTRCKGKDQICNLSLLLEGGVGKGEGLSSAYPTRRASVSLGEKSKVPWSSKGFLNKCG